MAAKLRRLNDPDQQRRASAPSAPPSVICRPNGCRSTCSLVVPHLPDRAPRRLSGTVHVSMAKWKSPLVGDRKSPPLAIDHRLGLERPLILPDACGVRERGRPPAPVVLGQSHSFSGRLVAAAATRTSSSDTTARYVPCTATRAGSRFRFVVGHSRASGQRACSIRRAASRRIGSMTCW